MRCLLLTVFFLITLISNSQNSGEYPLEIPIYLSGTFGELRPNHFHAGIDIKTQGKEGVKVYSIGGGYISRIQISEGGYGKALYIKHDNGQSSVYAHLQKFSPRIEKIVKDIQYKKETYTLRVYPSSNEIRIKNNELIGLSGNTGRSFGPHLHYELRDEKDRPINPLKYKNRPVKDTISPVLLGLYYKEFTDKNILEEGAFKKVKTKKINQNLFVSDTLFLNGHVGFGVNSYDRMNNTWNKMGLTNIMTSVNGKKNFEMNLNSFSYNEWRHINTFIDYSRYKNESIRIQKLYIEKFNPLEMYDRSIGDGVIKVDKNKDELLYSIKLLDYNQNTTEVLVPIKWRQKNKFKEIEIINKDVYKIHNDSIYDLNFSNISVNIEKNTFYKDMNIQVFEENNSLFIDKDTIPLLRPITIKFNVNRYNNSLEKQLYIAKIEEKNNTAFVSNNIKDKNITAKINNLGTYSVKIDSIPPEISLMDIKNNQWISNRKKMKIKIRDSDSGIKSYRGTINDNWILLEYNPLKGILTYNFNDKVNIDKKENKLIVKIKDNVGNETVLNKVFFREIIK